MVRNYNVSTLKLLTGRRIGEKFLDWTDGPLPLETIIEASSLYWLSKCVHSNLWSYRHVRIDTLFPNTRRP